MQFKNYLPLRRGLIENMTVNILVRETQFPLSDRLTTTLLQGALEKEITKREYHQNIVKVAGGSSRPAQLPYSEIKEIVELCEATTHASATGKDEIVTYQWLNPSGPPKTGNIC